MRRIVEDGVRSRGVSAQILVAESIILVYSDQFHYSPYEGYEVAVGVLQERLLHEVRPGPVQGRHLRVEAFPE